MSDIISKGEDLFAALRTGDDGTLRRLLSPDFRGELTAGLPHGLGRVHHGLDAMINDGWVALGEFFEIVPEVDTFYDASGVLIAQGHYVGTAVRTGKPVRAAFAHFWNFDGQRFTSVYQVTDSGTWRDAAS